MVLLGLLLIVLAVAAAAWLVVGTRSLTTPVDLPTPGVHVGMTPLALLIAGAAAMLLLALGFGLIRGSVKRRRRPAKEAKEAQRQAEIEENIRADERARAEESHRIALAERDRVREDEFRSRLSDEEQRIRADERAKVERDLQARRADSDRDLDAGPVAGAAGGATAVGGAAAAHRDRGGLGEPGSGADQPGRRDDRGGGWHDDGATDSGDVQRSADAERPVDDTQRSADQREADEAQADEDGTEREKGPGDRFRTVADKLMGRGPTGHA